MYHDTYTLHANAPLKPAELCLFFEFSSQSARPSTVSLHGVARMDDAFAHGSNDQVELQETVDVDAQQLLVETFNQAEMPASGQRRTDYAQFAQEAHSRMVAQEVNVPRGLSKSSKAGGRGTFGGLARAKELVEAANEKASLATVATHAPAV